MPPIWLATYRNAKGGRSSVWTGHCSHVIPPDRFECGVMGCGERVAAFRSSNGDVYIHPHKCISNRVHASAMRAWTARFYTEAQFINRVCPICRTTPMRVSKQKPPGPHIRIYGSYLVVEIDTHRVRLIVNFVTLRPGGLERSPPGYVDITLKHTDPIPVIATNGPLAGAVSLRPCGVCRTNMKLPMKLSCAKCSRCGQLHDTVTIDTEFEIPVIARSTTWRRKFILQDGRIHVFEAPGCRHRFISNVDYVWSIPIPPKVSPRLLQGSIAVKPCPACVPPEPPAAPPPAPSMDELFDELAVTAVAAIDPNPDLGTCYLCNYVKPNPQLVWCDPFPSSRHAIATPFNDGCYLCTECLSNCTDCGKPALRELDTLCDRCFRARGYAASDSDSP